MDTDSKKSAYHTTAFHIAGEAMMSFKPINEIHQQLCAFHVYSTDRTRHVQAHHFCKHLSHDFHQCVIYDSDDPNARLIGIEYIVSEKIFATLPEEERKYWHSHKYEVESGILQLQTKDLIPAAATDLAEQPAMLELQKTYGKTIHTWAYDIHPELPLGPPHLMMAYTGDGQMDSEMVKARDEKVSGQSTEEKRKLRAGYLPSYTPLPGADAWQATGKGISLEPVTRDVKQ